MEHAAEMYVTPKSACVVRDKGREKPDMVV